MSYKSETVQFIPNFAVQIGILNIHPHTSARMQIRFTD